MLPKVHHKQYKEFKQALEQLQQTLNNAQLDAPGLQRSYLETQQFFQQQIVTLDTADLEPADEPRVRSYQTEMSKQLRLLGMNVMFLQAARQPGTAIDRQMHLCDRLQTLIGYCDVLLQLN